MPTFDITLNIYIFLLTVVLSALLGYLPRSRQLAKKERKIVEMEQEVMQANAETLENQREYCELEARLKDQELANPVIPIQGKNRQTGTN